MHTRTPGDQKLAASLNKILRFLDGRLSDYRLIENTFFKDDANLGTPSKVNHVTLHQ